MTDDLKDWLRKYGDVLPICNTWVFQPAISFSISHKTLFELLEHSPEALRDHLLQRLEEAHRRLTKQIELARLDLKVATEPEVIDYD